jgi:hypothetical protein
MGLSNWIENYCKYQTTEITNVIPVARWSEREEKFYIDSVAGLLVYKPKSLKDLTRFRNEWINRFEQVCRGWPHDNTPVSKNDERRLFEFYEEIRSKEKIKYTANLRTRLKGVKWSLKV